MTKEDYIKELVQNLPEYCQSLDCVYWRYKECQFTFIDPETGKDYVIGMPELLIGFDLMVAKITWPGESASDEAANDRLCGCDADVVDMLIQYSIFGEVIYG